MKQLTNNGGALSGNLTESDLILRLVDIFCENGLEWEVSGDNRLTVRDEGAVFELTVTRRNED